DPVGAATSVSSPRWIAGQPAACASVGVPKRASNHAATIGWNPDSGTTDGPYLDRAPARRRLLDDDATEDPLPEVVRVVVELRGGGHPADDGIELPRRDRS